MNKLFAYILASLILAHSAFGAEPGSPSADHSLIIRSQAAADILFEIQQHNSQAGDSVPTPIGASDVLTALELAGVSKALVLSSAYLFSMPDINPGGELPLVKQENNYVSQQVALGKTRLAGLCSVNPLADYALDEIQRCAQSLGLKGLYLNFSNSNINLRSSEHITTLASLFEFLEVLHFPVLLDMATRSHTYGSVDVKLFIDNVLDKAPSIDIQITKLGGRGGFDTKTDRVLREFLEAFDEGRLEPSRVQFDLASTIIAPNNEQTAQQQKQLIAQHDLLTARIRQLDPQQVLFATGPPGQFATATTLGHEISLNAANIRRLLSLTDQELATLFRTQSRLFD